MKKCKHLSESYTKECMNCTRVKQCYHGRMDNYTPVGSSKKKDNMKTSKKKYNYYNIRDNIKRIGENANKFNHHKDVSAFFLDRLVIGYNIYCLEISLIYKIKNEYGDIEYIDINKDEEKFLNEKFRKIAKKLKKEYNIDEEARVNKMLSINFGD